MRYEVFDPSPALQPFIKCFWMLEDAATAKPVRQRVVPDGCMEMIFHYGDPYRQYFEDGSSLVQPPGFVYGQITTFLEIEPVGNTGIISARFLPEGITPFLTIPVKQLENKSTGLDILFGHKGKELEEQVRGSDSTAVRIALIENFLLALPVQQPAADKIIQTCIGAIYGCRGQMGMKELADKSKVNRRSMERRFASSVGISPKQLSKVVRLQYALKRLGQKQFSSLTDLAYESGYYDQAHFINEFKEFTGLSPRAFFSENLRLSALFLAAE